MTGMEQAIQQAKKMIEEGVAACVAIRHGRIIGAAAGRGVGPVLQLYEQGQLTGSFLVDKVIGKAAAMVMTRGGFAGCHGIIVSKAALQWLQQNHVAVTYDHLTDYIVNRTGDGMCPMEQTVLNLQEDTQVISVLQQKLAQLRKGSPQ